MKKRKFNNRKQRAFIKTKNYKKEGNRISLLAYLKAQNIYFYIISLILVILLIRYYSNNYFNSFNYSALSTKIFSKTIYDPQLKLNVFFCPFNHCLDNLLDAIEKYKNGTCGFYNIDLAILEYLNSIADNLTIYLQTREKFYSHIGEINNYSHLHIIFINYSRGIFHPKFCIFSNLTIIQSMNPTIENSLKDINDQVFIYSEKVSRTLKQIITKEKIHHKNKFEIFVNSKNYSLIITNYNIEDHILRLIENSKEMFFMYYTLTRKNIVDRINKKIHFGFRSKYNNQYVIFPNNTLTFEHPFAHLHTKIIFNDSAVITGSYNPTKSAKLYNYEINVIIHSKSIAKRYFEFLKFLIHYQLSLFQILNFTDKFNSLKSKLIYLTPNLTSDQLYNDFISELDNFHYEKRNNTDNLVNITFIDCNDVQYTLKYYSSNLTYLPATPYHSPPLTLLCYYDKIKHYKFCDYRFVYFQLRIKIKMRNWIRNSNINKILNNIDNTADSNFNKFNTYLYPNSSLGLFNFKSHLNRCYRNVLVFENLMIKDFS